MEDQEVERRTAIAAEVVNLLSAVPQGLAEQLFSCLDIATDKHAPVIAPVRQQLFTERLPQLLAHITTALNDGWGAELVAVVKLQPSREQ